MENVEIERKFLVKSAGLVPPGRAIRIRQGYLAASSGLAVRVRQKDELAFLTIKAARDRDSRYEFEYSIPAGDASMMLSKLCTRPPIEKCRYEIIIDDHTWEVDIFEGSNAGLIVAEIELTSTDQSFSQPDWLGPEVTHDARFMNSALYENPFANWGVTYQDLVKSIAAHRSA